MMYLYSILLSLLFTFNASLREAPRFALRDINGEETVLDSALVKGPVILLFWATWCKYCKEELDLLNEIQEEQGDSNLTIFGISIDSPRQISKIKSIARTHKWKFPTLLDSSQRVKNLYKVIALPTLFIISEEGNIVYSRTGYNPAEKSSMKEIILKNVQQERE